jgi:hypothetical protein
MVSKFKLATGVFIAMAAASAADAMPYTTLDPAYTAEIYAADTNYSYTLGVAFIGNTLYRSNDGGGLYTVDPVNTTVVNGTTVHVTSGPTSVGGAGWIGRGIAGGADGFLYGNQSGGIRKIDVNTMTSTILPNSVGGNYGIGFLSNGDLVYNAGSQVHKYQFGTQTDTVIFSAVAFGDGLSITPDDHIVVADLSANKIDILDASGNLINAFTSSHDPDGTAYGLGAIFKANTDGTLTKVTFSGPGFTGVGTETVIATGLLYHDLATVGPDFSFYLTALGAHYENGVQGPYGDGSVIRLSLVGGGGFGNDPGTKSVPEPGTLALFAAGFAVLTRVRRRKA